jgi:hypothetical protein
MWCKYKYEAMKCKLLTLALLLVVAACRQAGQDESANGVTGAQMQNGVYFVNLKDGDKVKSPFVVQMGVSGMTVEPAGEMHQGKGHYHLIIDGSYTEKGEMVGKDATHLHFGKGETVDTLNLSPGDHTLTLQFADGLHISYGKEWSSTIKITVVQ